MNPSAPIRVFVVDDHPLVREWIGTLLRLQADIAVIGEAEDQSTALAAMLAQPPDVAIIDLTLRRGTGIELIKELQKHLPGTRSLVLSMHEEIGDVERALRAGARGYVMKRESTRQIVAAIREVHAGRLYADPEVQVSLASRVLDPPAAGAREPTAELSDRELEVFRRLGLGHPTRQIAADLGVNLKTIQTYCSRIKEKLGLAHATDLVQAAVRAIEAERHVRDDPA